mgnify:CR=1 FL=1
MGSNWVRITERGSVGGANDGLMQGQCLNRFPSLFGFKVAHLQEYLYLSPDFTKGQTISIMVSSILPKNKQNALRIAIGTNRMTRFSGVGFNSNGFFNFIHRVLQFLT